MPRFVFTTDIEKMYRQIQVHPKDQQLQLIVWRHEPTQNIKCYRLQTVTYGTRSAPYLATRCLKQLAVENQSNFPLGSKALERDFYVDDALCGSDSLVEAREIQQQLQTILGDAGFKLRKWCANHPQLLCEIPQEDKEINFELSSDIEKSAKTLGLVWTPKTDSIRIRTNIPGAQSISKRAVASDLAKIYDPLGLVSPVVVKAKIFVQQLWTLKLGWDDQLSPQHQQEWAGFRKDIESLNDTSIPRHVFNKNIPKEVQVHCFTDASEKAYGAAIYIRSVNKDGTISINLLCSKSRVAPIKTQTIPRLELLAAQIGAQLTNQVQKDLNFKGHIFFWTDSQIVLCWINSHASAFQTFVSHRVANIQRLTCPEQWRYVNTKDNPADVLSRGLMPKELLKCNIWFYGPLFLYSKETTWPKAVIKGHLIHTDTERKAEKATLTTTVITTTMESFIYELNTRNSFYRMQRVLGYIVRFINKCRRKSREDPNSSESAVLSPNELEDSLAIIIKAIQHAAFKVEISKLRVERSLPNSHSLSSLTPFLDEEGILRVGGRLSNSSLPYETKHQILLPYNDVLVKLLLTEMHIKNKHCGPQALLYQSRQRFWIIKGIAMAKSAVNHCVRCTRTRPTLYQQVMGNLPLPRVQAARPFINAGVDFCGPLTVHYKIRGKRPTKVYIAIYCCFATKAVHLELVGDLTTEAFIGSLKRFIAKRGTCENLYCDNATNFVGARNRLPELKDIIYSDKAQKRIGQQCSSSGINFSFIPPRAPHFGGLWEAAVKSAKHLLIRSVGATSLTFEELNTVIHEIEAILNSRPITPMSSNPNDLIALTPGHFLIGQPLTSMPEHTSSTQQPNLLTRWEQVSYIKGQFWKRWSSEYLSGLQQRHKWKQPNRNVDVGTLVILKEDNSPPLKWPLGRIVKVYEGDDQRVRVVDVKTNTGVCKRAIHRLAPLFPEEESSPTVNSDKMSTEVPAKRRRTSVSSNLLTLIVSLLILPIILGAQIENTVFGSKLGVHFENIGITTISATEWNLLIYYDLEAFWNELSMLSNGTKALKHLCDEMTLKNACDTLILHFEHIEDELKMESVLLARRRSRRGAINMVGNVANSLFGILDSEYAENMSHTIAQVKENENHLIHLLKNQTSIVDSTINILKHDQTAVKTKFDQLDNQIQLILNSVRSNDEERYQEKMYHTFTTLAMQLTIIATNLQRMQSSMLDVLTDAHHGKISPLLLSPNQLQQEVAKVKMHLPSSLELPVNQDELLKLYTIMSVKGGLTKDKVVFSITLPLVSHERFELFHLISIPIWTNNTMIAIDICSQYLAINNHIDQYFPMSSSELKSCIIIKDGSYMCSKLQVRYNHGSTVCKCELNLFNNFTQSDCHLRRMSEEFTWISLQHRNQWIYATKKESRATVVCGREITQLILKNSGILTLQPECMVKHNFMAIQAHQQVSSTLMASYTSLGNLTEVSRIEQLKPIVMEANPNKYTPQIANLSLLQSSLATEELLQLPNKMENQNYHHIAVGYTALFAALLILMYLKCKRKQNFLPTPRPRQQQNETDFTVHI